MRVQQQSTIQFYSPFSILHKQDPKKFKLLHSHPSLEMTLYPFQDDGGAGFLSGRFTLGYELLQ